MNLQQIYKQKQALQRKTEEETAEKQRKKLRISKGDKIKHHGRT